MSYKLTHTHLERLCAINSFIIPNNEMLFFGLRGTLPEDGFDHALRPQQEMLDYVSPNYTTPRCTIGQWMPSQGKLAVFPASTVPSQRYVAIARSNNGVGTNEMMTGFYTDYRKGAHKATSRSGHAAFRQNSDRPHRRTADDLDFDADDRVEIGNPNDNLHAAYCATISSGYSSAGCQVVVGMPQRNDGASVESGPWKAFRRAAYAQTQTAFPYILIEGWEAQRVVSLGTKKTSALLRFGSNSPLVTDVQTKLQLEGFYEGRLDTDFGGRTLKAVLRFQEKAFGPGGDDGIVGPATAEALGLTTWPSL